MLNDVVARSNQSHESGNDASGVRLMRKLMQDDRVKTEGAKLVSDMMTAVWPMKGMFFNIIIN